MNKILKNDKKQIIEEFNKSLECAPRVPYTKASKPSYFKPKMVIRKPKSKASVGPEKDLKTKKTALKPKAPVVKPKFNIKLLAKQLEELVLANL